MNPTVPTRRQFFGAAAAAALLRPGIAADQPTEIRLGVATYSLRNFPRTQAISMIKELGVRDVSIKEVHLLYKSTPEEMIAGRDEFDAAGLHIASGGVKCGAIIQQMIEPGLTGCVVFFVSMQRQTIFESLKLQRRLSGTPGRQRDLSSPRIE